MSYFRVTLKVEKSQVQSVLELFSNELVNCEPYAEKPVNEHKAKPAPRAVPVARKSRAFRPRSDDSASSLVLKALADGLKHERQELIDVLEASGIKASSVSGTLSNLRKHGLIEMYSDLSVRAK